MSDSRQVERAAEVWLGDIVRMGAGKTRWTVVAAGREWLEIKSAAGARQTVTRARVQLMERCPDGPQLETWPDGRAYLAGELVYGSSATTHAVVRWADDREDWAHAVTLSVCTNGQMSIKSEGTTNSEALMTRAEVLDLAAALFRMADQVSW